MHDSFARRQHQREFVARSLAARDEATRSGHYVSAGTVLSELGNMLAEARAKVDAEIVK